MNRVMKMVALGVAGAACATWACLANTYAAYYDCSSGRETNLTILCAEPMDVEYTLSLFSPIGRPIARTTGTVGPYACVSFVVNQMLPAAWEAEACRGPEYALNKGEHALCMGGLALLETTGSVLVKVTFADGEDRPISTTIDQAVPDEREHGDYWYGARFVVSSTEETRLSIVNPYDERIILSISVFDEQGTLLFSDTALPLQHETATYDIRSYVPDRDQASGIIDVMSKFPVVLALEYSGENGSLLSMEQTAHFHFFLD